MDRFDCQFIMLYFVSIYYKTFIRERDIVLEDVLGLVARLSLDDKVELLHSLQESIQLNSLFLVCLTKKDISFYFVR